MYIYVCVHTCVLVSALEQCPKHMHTRLLRRGGVEIFNINRKLFKIILQNML